MDRDRPLGLPGGGGATDRGTVTISGERVAVDPHGRRSPGVDLGQAAIILAWSMRTHLDLSGLQGRVPRADFTSGSVP